MGRCLDTSLPAGPQRIFITMVSISDLGVGTEFGPVAVFLLFLQSTGTVHEPLSLSLSLSYTHTLPYGFIQACMTTASNYHTHRYHSLTEIVKAKSRASYYGRKSRASYYGGKGCNMELVTFLPVVVLV